MNLKALRNKMNSTKKTQQTTRAMKMVAASKLRKAQDNIVNARPYAYRLREVIQKISSHPELKHPFLEKPQKVEQVLVVVLTSDRGLCGGFNASVCKGMQGWLESHRSRYSRIDMICIGGKGESFFKRRGLVPLETITHMARSIRYEMAQEIAEKVLQFFVSGQYQEVHFVYNEFKSALSQKVCYEQLLPVMPAGWENVQGFSQDFIFEPSVEAILDLLLKKYFAIEVYRVMQESMASEHGARMSAMENATRNAGEVIDRLQLEYNKGRQAKITTELVEIVSGAQAL